LSRTFPPLCSLFRAPSSHLSFFFCYTWDPKPIPARCLLFRSTFPNVTNIRSLDPNWPRCFQLLKTMADCVPPSSHDSSLIFCLPPPPVQTSLEVHNPQWNLPVYSHRVTSTCGPNLSPGMGFTENFVYRFSFMILSEAVSRHPETTSSKEITALSVVGALRLCEETKLGKRKHPPILPGLRIGPCAIFIFTVLLSPRRRAIPAIVIFAILAGRLAIAFFLWLTCGNFQTLLGLGI